jgi:hypothetical protein
VIHREIFCRHHVLTQTEISRFSANSPELAGIRFEQLTKSPDTS